MLLHYLQKEVKPQILLILIFRLIFFDYFSKPPCTNNIN